VRRLAGILGLLCVSGCTVGPDYKSPTVEKVAPAKLDAAEAPDASAAGIVAGSPIAPEWWTTLKDDKLNQLVVRLIDANLDLKTAESRVREARAARGIAAAALYPQLNLQGQAGAQGSGAAFAPTLGYNVGFDASWEIDVFGGVRRGLEAAEAGVDVAQEARRDTLVSLLGELGLNYVELRGAQRQLEIAKQNVDLNQKTFDIALVRKKTGLASDLEVNQAATQLETTRAGVPRFEASIAKAIYRISVLLGREPDALVPELETPGPIPDAPPLIPIGLPSELLKRRPDIRRAERAMAAATAQVGVAKADLYPKFALTGSLGYSSQGGGTPSFFIGPSISWPIFNGGKIVSNIAVQDARLEQAVLGYRTTILLALEDVENSLTAFAKEQIRRDTLVRALADAEKAEATAETQYKQGIVEFLNVVDSQRALANARQSLVTSEQALLTDLVAVYKALGGGWDVFETKLAEQEQKPSNVAPPR
jgi:NodT family efflux transporter outer membrane factor (OMF) lipoprotein